jgi:hypothetical protein
MTLNVGNADRIVRALIGLAILSLFVPPAPSGTLTANRPPHDQA